MDTAQILALIAIAFLVAELLTLDFVFASLAIGAAAGSLTAWLYPDGGSVASASVAVVVALGSVFLLRPLVKRYLTRTTPKSLNAWEEALAKGTEGTAISRVTDADGGQVTWAGNTWSAVTPSRDEVVNIGEKFTVIEINEITLTIKRSI